MHRNAHTASDIFWSPPGPLIPMHWAVQKEQVLHILAHMLSKSQLHLSCTTCHNLLESFEQVVPNYNEITSWENYIFLPPEITGVAKHNWLCSQMKNPHSLQESSCQPWWAQGLWSTPKCNFLTQGKTFALRKNMSLQAGGSTWEANASFIGMVQPEKRLGVVVAWSPLSDGLLLTTG